MGSGCTHRRSLHCKADWAAGIGCLFFFSFFGNLPTASAHQNSNTHQPVDVGNQTEEEEEEEEGVHKTLDILISGSLVGLCLLIMKKVWRSNRRLYVSATWECFHTHRFQDGDTVSIVIVSVTNVKIIQKELHDFETHKQCVYRCCKLKEDDEEIPKL